MPELGARRNRPGAAQSPQRRNRSLTPRRYAPISAPPPNGLSRFRSVFHLMSLAPAQTPPSIVTERPEDAPLVEALVLRAFGPGRYAKAAERLREGRAPLYDLSFVAWDSGRLVGCAQQWPVRVGDTPAILFGPIAVEPAYRHHGLGSSLTERACDAAADAGHRLIVLVGDMPLFGPLGFVPAPGVRIPGPVDQRRVLVRALEPGAADGLEGLVSAA
jgi:predicted N-acetyltransferase YhbS